RRGRVSACEWIRERYGTGKNITETNDAARRANDARPSGRGVAGATLGACAAGDAPRAQLLGEILVDGEIDFVGSAAAVWSGRGNSRRAGRFIAVAAAAARQRDTAGEHQNREDMTHHGRRLGAVGVGDGIARGGGVGFGWRLTINRVTGPGLLSTSRRRTLTR